MKKSIIIVDQCEEFEGMIFVEYKRGLMKDLKECKHLLKLLLNDYRIREYDKSRAPILDSEGKGFIEKYLLSKGYKLIKPPLFPAYDVRKSHEKAMKDARAWAKKKKLQIRRWKKNETYNDPF